MLGEGYEGALAGGGVDYVFFFGGEGHRGVHCKVSGAGIWGGEELIEKSGWSVDCRISVEVEFEEMGFDRKLSLLTFRVVYYRVYISRIKSFERL